MTRVGHLLDRSADWEQRVGLAHLLDRLPRDQWLNVVGSLNGRAALRHADWGASIDSVRPLLAWTALSGPAARRFVDRHGLDLVQAWGTDAALAARSGGTLPIVLRLYDPGEAARAVKKLRALADSGGLAVSCTSAIVRRRLVEGGFNPALAVVIRPGVDFGLIGRARKSDLRHRLGVPSHCRLAIVPEPVTRTGGQLEAFMALAMKNSMSHDLRVIVPGNGREVERIRRVAQTVPGESALVLTGTNHAFEELVAISDVLLVTPRCDISTTAIAWAMAAGVPVIGTAVYAVAELISHQVNGQLFKQTLGRSMTASILQRLDDTTSQKQWAEAARGQAFEVFGMRRYAEQHMQLYDNLLNGRHPGEGIVDSSFES